MSNAQKFKKIIQGMDWRKNRWRRIHYGEILGVGTIPGTYKVSIKGYAYPMDSVPAISGASQLMMSATDTAGDPADPVNFPPGGHQIGQMVPVIFLKGNPQMPLIIAKSQATQNPSCNTELEFNDWARGGADCWNNRHNANLAAMYDKLDAGNQAYIDNDFMGTGSPSGVPYKSGGAPIPHTYYEIGQNTVTGAYDPELDNVFNAAVNGKLWDDLYAVGSSYSIIETILHHNKVFIAVEKTIFVPYSKTGHIYCFGAETGKFLWKAGKKIGAGPPYAFTPGLLFPDYTVPTIYAIKNIAFFKEKIYVAFERWDAPVTKLEGVVQVFNADIPYRSAGETGGVPSGDYYNINEPLFEILLDHGTNHIYLPKGCFPCTNSNIPFTPLVDDWKKFIVIVQEENQDIPYTTSTYTIHAYNVDPNTGTQTEIWSVAGADYQLIPNDSTPYSGYYGVSLGYGESIGGIGSFYRGEPSGNNVCERKEIVTDPVALTYSRDWSKLLAFKGYLTKDVILTDIPGCSRNDYGQGYDPGEPYEHFDYDKPNLVALNTVDGTPIWDKTIITEPYGRFTGPVLATPNKILACTTEYSLYEPLADLIFWREFYNKASSIKHYLNLVDWTTGTVAKFLTGSATYDWQTFPYAPDVPPLSWPNNVYPYPYSFISHLGITAYGSVAEGIAAWKPLCAFQNSTGDWKFLLAGDSKYLAVSNDFGVTVGWWYPYNAAGPPNIDPRGEIIGTHLAILSEDGTISNVTDFSTEFPYGSILSACAVKNHIYVFSNASKIICLDNTLTQLPGWNFPTGDNPADLEFNKIFLLGRSGMYYANLSAGTSNIRRINSTFP